VAGGIRCATPALRVLFYPDLASPCVQGKHLMYRWNGEHIAQVLEVSAVKRPKAV